MTGLGSLQRQYLILILHCTNKCSVLSGSVGVSRIDDVKLSPWYNALMAVVVSISSIFFFAAALLLTIPFTIAYTFGMGVSEADDVELSPCQQSARNVLTSICSTSFFGAALVLVVPVIVVYTDMTIFTLVCRQLCNSCVTHFALHAAFGGSNRGGSNRGGSHRHCSNHGGLRRGLVFDSNLRDGHFGLCYHNHGGLSYELVLDSNLRDDHGLGVVRLCMHSNHCLLSIDSAGDYPLDDYVQDNW